MTLEDVHLSWWHWFHILIQLEGLLTILMNYMSLLSLLVDVIRMSVSTVFFLMQLDSGIISSRMFSCDYDLNGFKFRLNRHLLSLGAPSYQLFFMLLFFVFFIVPYFLMAVLPHVEWTLIDMFYGDKFAKYFWKGKESLFSGAPVCYWWMLLKWLYSNVLIWKPLFWELSFLKPTGIYFTIVWSKKRTYCSSSLSVLILILPLMSQTKVFWFVLYVKAASVLTKWYM